MSTRLIVPANKQLHAIGSLGPEHVNHAAIGIAAQALAHQRSEAIHALAKVDRPRRHQDAQRARRDDHERPFTTCGTTVSHPTSAPHSARTTIPAVSIVIEGVREEFGSD